MIKNQIKNSNKESRTKPIRPLFYHNPTQLYPFYFEEYNLHVDKNKTSYMSPNMPVQPVDSLSVLYVANSPR